MKKIKTAIILAAGLGNRLRPLTNELPKCLTEINGKTILISIMENLESIGIEKVAVVIGYLGDAIIKSIGRRYKSMAVDYILNDIYYKTNTMYSVWLANEYLRQGAVLVEGDCILEDRIMEILVAADQRKSYWVADQFSEHFDGSMLTADKKGRIIGIQIVKGKLAAYRENYFKSAGTLKLNANYGSKFCRWLDEEVKMGNVNIYYDLILANHLTDAPIYICNIKGLKWQEIDNLEDLYAAEKIFEN